VDLSIGELAERTGVRASTLRYYEEQQLLRPSGRVAGRRRYDLAAVERLRVIQLCKAMGFDLQEVRVLLHREDDAVSYAALAQQKLDEVDRLQEALATMRALLTHALHCGCSGPRECASAPTPPPDLSGVQRLSRHNALPRP